MNFPDISDHQRIKRLQLPERRKLRVVIDTDTYNEIDDQFAVVHALLSPERLTVEAIYAAPFTNNRSTGPADGMEKSYEEILRLVERLNLTPDGWTFRGSTGYLPDYETPFRSEAALDLVERALKSTDRDPLVVVAIGAITNVASAILIEPRIIEKIVVVWLGGHAFYWPHTREFNLMQDALAGQIIFDSGVPLIQVPCNGVTTHLRTTVAELERYVQGKSAIGDYLVETFKGYHQDHYGWSKEIWDVAAVAYLLNTAWTPSNLQHSPIITSQLTWSFDKSRHLIRSVNFIHRDPIFQDLFSKLDGWAAGQIEIAH